MQRSIDRYEELFSSLGWKPVCPSMTQTLREDELCLLLPQYEGWIIGDDNATEGVFRAGVAGRLRAAVKWGVGVDNIDFSGALKHGIRVHNTPGMFGNEVADIALGYVIGLARETFWVDQAVKRGEWAKPIGMSLDGKVAAVVGFGDIGRALTKRLLACGMRVHVYDPAPVFATDLDSIISRCAWPSLIEEADFLVLCCALNASTRHLVNADLIQKRLKRGVRIVNVSRGPLIAEQALLAGLEQGIVHSAALEVFETEPLPLESPLRGQKCLFGSHNASNTQEAVDRTSHRAVQLLALELSNHSETSL